jgi:hypothetical protein
VAEHRQAGLGEALQGLVVFLLEVLDIVHLSREVHLVPVPGKVDHRLGHGLVVLPGDLAEIGEIIAAADVLDVGCEVYPGGKGAEMAPVEGKPILGPG